MLRQIFYIQIVIIFFLMALPAAYLSYSDYDIAEAAQLRETWDYKKLFLKSDLVIICTVVNVIDTDRVFSLKPHGIAADLQEEVVTVSVLSIIKGDSEEKVAFHNYRIVNTKEALLFNPPRTVQLESGPLSIKINDQNRTIQNIEYMVFLTGPNDGIYEFTSTYYYAADSIKQIHPTDILK